MLLLSGLLVHGYACRGAGQVQIKVRKAAGRRNGKLTARNDDTKCYHTHQPSIFMAATLVIVSLPRALATPGMTKDALNNYENGEKSLCTPDQNSGQIEGKV
jgi:hypothetical protein